MIGWLTHEGLDAYYRSGWEDGKYSLAKAYKAIEEASALRAGEYPGLDDKALAEATSNILMSEYNRWWGPGGECEEFPELKVATDSDGNPMIEYNLSTEVGAPMPFTGRIDTVVEFKGSLYTLEHKTSAPQRVARTFDLLRMGTQAKGQVILLKDNFPELPIRGVIGNVIVKKPGKGKPPCHREIITFTDLQLAKTKQDLGDSLRRISAMKSHWQEEVTLGGKSHDAAALHAFPMRLNSCSREFGSCDFAAICRNLEKPDAMTGNYNAKHKES